MKDKMRDSSLYIHQRDKLKQTLQIKELKWTERQTSFINLATDKKTRVIFVGGPAGTAKTFLSVFAALKLLNEKRISDIIYLRSAVEASDSKLGYLPGEAEDKMHFYGEPFFEKLEELLNKEDIKFLAKEKRVVVLPTNYIRGKSWCLKCFILDEAQNSGLKEIETVMTRLGHFSKCFVLADPGQSDLKNGNKGAFDLVSKAFDTQEWKDVGVHVFNFTTDDIVRDPLLKMIVAQFEVIKRQGH